MAAAASASSSSSASSSCIDEDHPSSPVWSRTEDKAFELALARHNLSSPHGFPELWQAIADSSGRSLPRLKLHFHSLLLDLQAIEDGLVPLPSYAPPTPPHRGLVSDQNDGSSSRPPSEASPGPVSRKGMPWTQEEHKSFLLGLAKFGKGDWRSISRNCVRTRTPTQVASHAQKYYIRLNSRKRERGRSSIDDDISNESRNVL